MNPPRNRKGETGNPPPTARASEFYPNQIPPHGNETGAVLVPTEAALLCLALVALWYAPERYHPAEIVQARILRWESTQFIKVRLAAHARGWRACF